MVATPEVISRIDDYLWAINAGVESLPDWARDWPEQSSENHAIVGYEWTELMVELDLLSEVYRAAQMSAMQRTRYLALVNNVRAALPILQQLALSPPRLALNDLPVLQEP